MKGLNSSSAIFFGSPHWWSRRDHGSDLEEHPLGAAAGVLQRRDDLQALGDLLPPRLAGRIFHLDAQIDEELLDVELGEELADGLRAHLGTERVGSVLFVEL